MAEAKAQAQESSSPRCLLLLAGGLPSSVSGTILLAGACKPLSYGTRLLIAVDERECMTVRLCASTTTRVANVGYCKFSKMPSSWVG